MNLTRSVWALRITLVLGLILGLGAGTPVWSQDKCDQDGDGYIADNGGCIRKNRGVEVDCDDSVPSEDNQCDDGGQVRFDAEFIQGTFSFGSAELTETALGFIVDAQTHDSSSDIAFSDAAVTLYPAHADNWASLFGVCPDVLDPPVSLAVPPGGVRIQKAASVMQIGFSGILAEGIDSKPVEVTVVLEGRHSSDVVLGVEGAVYVFDTFSLFARSAGKGKRKRCQQSLIQQPDPFSQLQTSPSSP